MPIEFKPDETGTMLEIHVSGKLVKADYDKFVPEFDNLVRAHGSLRVLFDMTGFEGWESAALWEDVKFSFKHFSDIERLAMVGDKRWEHAMASFCKPFTKAKIQYYDHADADAARAWLAET
jgi:hypothetical protein